MTDICICYGKLGAGSEVPSILKKVESFSGKGLTVQLFDAAAVAGEQHLRSAALHALRAQERKSMRTSTLGMEMLLYATGRRQIRDALLLAGLSKFTTAIAAIIVGPDSSSKAGPLMKALGAQPAGPEVAGGLRALERLGVNVKGATEKQLPDLVLELVALLDIER
jgi:KEOPS complex subunit Cgi121